MELFERCITIPAPERGQDIMEHIKEGVRFHLRAGEIPVRFAVTSSDDRQYFCELGVAVSKAATDDIRIPDIFNFRKRRTENTTPFNAAFLVPTGIGSEFGGHAGDATPIARMLAESCDTFLTHPNVVNASDINEMPHNSLFIEGSVLSRLLMGEVGLQKVRSNRVLVVLDDHPIQHFVDAAVNSVNAARATYGLNVADVICLNPQIEMRAEYSDSGCAVGTVSGLSHCLKVLEEDRERYDAVAFSSVIKVPHEYHMKYFESAGEMINPWGGVEAMLTHAISSIMQVPTAHAPMFENKDIENLETGVVDPRMSAEAVSMCFIQCVLKGLHKSPKIISNAELFNSPSVMSAEDISCMVIPDGCLGIPTLAALLQGIPVIAVRENTNVMKNDLSRLPWREDQLIVVDTYLEAAGAMSALKAGVSIASIKRPLQKIQAKTIRQNNKEVSSSVAT